jgi:hypothetical protein
MRAVSIAALVAGCLALAAPLASAAPAPLAAPAGAVKYTFFENPRHTVGCVISKSGARCDVRGRAWDPPPKPDSCELDWGNGLEVDRRGVARFVCAGDTVFGGKRVLAYRDSITRGRFTCTSHRNGVRCVNERNEHGFKVSRRFARWF